MAALVEEKRGPRNPHPNRVSAQVEQKILDYALAFPTHGAQRVSNELDCRASRLDLPDFHGADNGREFCGIQQRHPYELLLAVEDIEHRTTKVRSPRTSDFVERMNRTLLDECFRVRGRQTRYVGVDEIQRDLARASCATTISIAAIRAIVSQGSHAGSGVDGSAWCHEIPTSSW